MNTSRPFSFLTVSFIAWKSLLLLITSAAPGTGYDTSTGLLRHFHRLVRWDAIYFTQIAERGHLFEQEWAWGKGHTILMAILSSFIGLDIATAGVMLSHMGHYLSVLLVWQIGRSLDNKTEAMKDNAALPVLAAGLHIISPAGVFLSAPYSEALFSSLNLLGFWFYVEATMNMPTNSIPRKCCLLIASGVSFGCATFVRSNGIFSGIPFLYTAITLALRNVLKPTLSQMVVLLATTIAGLCIAVGFALPQYAAYQQYCSYGPDSRSWCNSRVPLIYSFVQSHYWGVGFLRYWTVSNLPLFLLAAPVLMMLFYSGLDGLLLSAKYPVTSTAVRGLALPQLALAVLAVTNYHVQIVTRLSSGYPWIHIWVAQTIIDRARQCKVVIRYFVLYALIQAGLFASFLPPA